MLPDAAHTAAQAAFALGCAVEEIAKSIVFASADGTAVVVVAGGATRVDEARLAATVGPIGRADPDFVKSATGYSIGGVTPFGLPETARLLIDRSIEGLDQCFCAAGHPHAVVQTAFAHLVALSGARPVEVT